MEHKTLIGLEGARSHRAANAIDKLASALEAITNAISVVVLTAMIIVIFFSVIARYVFSEGISWSEEFAIWGFYLADFYRRRLGIRGDRHVAVDIILERLPIRPPASR